jgi:hypothetical protein
MVIEGFSISTPDGHLKIPHLWPGQNPPAAAQKILLIFSLKIYTFFFFIQKISVSFRSNGPMPP